MLTEQQLNEERGRIAAEIKERRQHLKISQRELAERTGLKEATVYRIEKAIMWVDMKKYIIILDALGLQRGVIIWPEK